MSYLTKGRSQAVYERETGRDVSWDMDDLLVHFDDDLFVDEECETLSEVYDTGIGSNTADRWYWLNRDLIEHLEWHDDILDVASGHRDTFDPDGNVIFDDYWNDPAHPEYEDPYYDSVEDLYDYAYDCMVEGYYSGPHDDGTDHQDRTLAAAEPNDDNANIDLYHMGVCKLRWMLDGDHGFCKELKRELKKRDRNHFNKIARRFIGERHYLWFDPETDR